MENNAENAKNAKNAKFICEKCNFRCNKQSNWNIHISTNKHLDIKKDLPKPTSFICECGIEYKYSSGLSKHRKKCSLLNKEPNKEENTQLINNNITNEQQPILENKSVPPLPQEMVFEIIKELKDMMKELLKNNNNNIVNNNTTNNNTTNNTNFNLNFFLNERCKDAINIMDFINDLQIEFSDLENVGHRGYIEGITQIILKHMKDMDVEKRPMHCTDFKRETMYIKDQDTWDKDNENKSKMKQFIGKVAKKNLDKLLDWIEYYPECKDIENKKNYFYMDIHLNSLGGVGEEQQNKFDEKIIRNIAKNVLVDKSS